LEASFNVVRRYCIKVGSLECNEELGLGNVVDISLDEGFKFLTIYLL